MTGRGDRGPYLTRALRKQAPIIAAAAVALAGLTGGCSDNGNGVPFLLGYSVIDISSNNDTLPQAAFDGLNSFLVVYDEIVTSTTHNLIGTFVDQSGNVLNRFAIGTNIETTANDGLAPQIAFDGTSFLVVYQEYNGADHDIMGFLVAAGGATQVGPFVIDVSANDDQAPAVAFNGTDYLVTYQRTVSGTNHDIIGALVDPAGNVLGGLPFDIDTSLTGDDITPAVASNHSTFLVAYQRVVGGSEGDILGAIVDPTFSATPPDVKLFDIDATSYDDQAPAVASDGTNYLVVYQEFYPSNRDIRGALVTVTGQPSVSFVPIDIDPNFDDYQPRVAWGTSRYLVAYTENTVYGDRDILGARITSAGQVQSFALPINTYQYDDFNPSVVFGTTSFLVPYEEAFSSVEDDIIGSLISS